jgi:hypothetical protein
VVKNDRIQFVSLDARSGRLTPVAAGSEPGWMSKLRDIDVTRFNRDAKVPLSQAILAAEETDRDAVAVAAGMGRSHSAIHAYNVLIARDGAVHRVAIDDENGAAIADANALGAWP